jgi:hypothetical protein
MDQPTLLSVAPTVPSIRFCDWFHHEGVPGGLGIFRPMDELVDRKLG